MIRRFFTKSFWFTFVGINRSVKSASDYVTWVNEVESISFKDSRKSNKDKENKAVQSIILICTSELKKGLIIDSISSVLNQSVANWELLVVADDSSQLTSICKDKRIKLFPKLTDSNFFELANSAALQVHGDLVTFITQGDILSIYAVEYLTHCIDVQLIVTDEDSLDVSGKRCNPLFKPDWNPDYLSNYNYFSKGVSFDRKLFAELGGFNFKLNDPFHDLVLRATAQLHDNQIRHLTKVLYHFKNNEKGKTHRIMYKIPQPSPMVSVIIPTKDQLQLLKTCLDGLFQNTSYENFEIIVIDNHSQKSETVEYLNDLTNNHKVSVLEYDKPFNYAEMNNFAVKQTKGSLLCFLNNDVSIIKDDWLTEMASHALRPEIGCVGAKLFYPDGTIQHAGVVLGLKGYASHAHKGFAGDDAGYCNRLVVTHNVSAVTAACLVMKKTIFEEVGGFDSVNLKVAYNDVDLCLKVREAGYRNLFTPHAQLIHHESKSRGKKRSKEQQKQLQEESAFLLEKWGGVLFSDPAYNKNLTLLKEDFSLGFDRINE